MHLHHQQVKVIGANGQVSLGKEFAGQTVLIDQVNKTTWVIKAGTFVPASEKWLHQSEHLAKLEKALSWVEKHEPNDNLDKIAKRAKKE